MGRGPEKAKAARLPPAGPGETTGAAAAYVGMTRGREANTAHLVADCLEDAQHGEVHES